MLLHRLAPEETSNNYSNFGITFWIDRFLLCTSVVPLLIAATILAVLHGFQDVGKCNLLPGVTSTDQSDFLNRFCSLQLANNVLHGRDDNRILVDASENRGSLQHEYFPFLLLIAAFILWLPHFIWYRSVNQFSRRDLTLVCNELRNFREAAMRELNRRGDDSELNLVDFTASVSDLPHLHACQINWSLTHYLSSWQNTDFYWRRFLAKHVTVFLFQSVAFLTIFIVLVANSGAPFNSFFLCQLPSTLLTMPPDSKLKPPSSVQCVLRSTFLVNISVVILYLCTIAGMLAQMAYFYSNYTQSRYSFREQRYFDSCFFGPYIRLMAYSQFRREELDRVRGMSISLEPGFLRCDFHYLSLLCTENHARLTDIFHVHYWTERFIRATRARRAGGISNRLRRSSCGFSRSEDVSLKLNFRRMKLKVEINDLFL